MRQLRSRVPFAIVGANTVVEIDGRKVRGRRYPWGIAEGLPNQSLSQIKLNIVFFVEFYDDLSQ